MYGHRTSIGVLLPCVPLYVCGVRVRFPTLQCTETEFVGEMKEDIPDTAGVTLVLHFSLMVLQ